jgi:hypothetical protein
MVLQRRHNLWRSGNIFRTFQPLSATRRIVPRFGHTIP